MTGRLELIDLISVLDTFLLRSACKTNRTDRLELLVSTSLTAGGQGVVSEERRKRIEKRTNNKRPYTLQFVMPIIPTFESIK
jgi:hypothetical protein